MYHVNIALHATATSFTPCYLLSVIDKDQHETVVKCWGNQHKSEPVALNTAVSPHIMYCLASV